MGWVDSHNGHHVFLIQVQLNLLTLPVPYLYVSVGLVSQAILLIILFVFRKIDLGDRWSLAFSQTQPNRLSLTVLSFHFNWYLWIKIHHLRWLIVSKLTLNQKDAVFFSGLLRIGEMQSPSLSSSSSSTRFHSFYCRMKQPICLLLFLM